MKNFVVIVIVLNLITELVEVVFPCKKMRSAIKSFVLTLMLYVVVQYLSYLL